LEPRAWPNRWVLQNGITEATKKLKSRDGAHYPEKQAECQQEIGGI
jgi:hypothetical protein